MTGEQQNATAVLSEQRERARKAVGTGRYKEALDDLHDGALNAFRLQDVSALEEIGALARGVIEKASDGYVTARGAEVSRGAQSYRCRSWQTLKSLARAHEGNPLSETSSQSR